MRGKLRHISRQAYPPKVQIIIGAPAALVANRYLRNKYETNREIKYWATWFLLKALTTTSYIQHWLSQKEYLLTWLQMNENTFRSHVAWLGQQGLLELDRRNYSIRLCGYEKAAEILGIEYNGNYEVDFSPATFAGKQTFQYLLRTEEFEHHKQRQAETLMYKIDNNPSLKNDLVYHLVQMGADYVRLHADPAYFAYRMLKLQIKLFKEGSDIFQYIMSLRADTNRSARLIKTHHKYRSCQSVAYMKRKMAASGFARVLKVAMESPARMRFKIPAQPDTPPIRIHNGMQDGYKWVPSHKTTMWVLTDQVSRLYGSSLSGNTLISKKQKYAA